MISHQGLTFKLVSIEIEKVHTYTHTNFVRFCFVVFMQTNILFDIVHTTTQAIDMNIKTQMQYLTSYTLYAREQDQGGITIKNYINY